MLDDENSKDSLKRQLENAKKEYEEFGGWEGFKSGEWLLKLIQKSLSIFVKNANAEYFRKKYPGKDVEFIVRKLTSVTARNTAIIGAITGAAVSADEIGAIAIEVASEGSATPEVLPGAVAIAVAAIAAEAFLVTRLQLQLVANIAKLYKVPLDPEDPEDILVILPFALGGAAAEEAGKFGAKIGAKATEKLIRKYVRKEFLSAIKRIAKKAGLKILQKDIIKYASPVASIAIGSAWNYYSTKMVGELARRHFKSYLIESGISAEELESIMSEEEFEEYRQMNKLLESIEKSFERDEPFATDLIERFKKGIWIAISNKQLDNQLEGMAGKLGQKLSKGAYDHES